MVIEKRSGRRLGKEGALVHVLRYSAPQERVLAINLPKDVVVLDVMMPELDGFETLKQIRETSTVPV
ncbi:MAG: DNA-binding response regulator, partial [Nitrososphaera sp.]